MKKMAMFMAAMVVACAAIAGDVYSFKMVCKVPEIRQAQMYYKDFKQETFKGYVEIAYNDDGSVVTPAQAVVYGNFAEGKVCKSVDVDVTAFNVYGKKVDKAELCLSLDLGDFPITLCGLGNCVSAKAGVSNCGDEGSCEQTIHLTKAAGNMTGLIGNIVCDPCDGKSWTWVFNSCVADMLLSAGDLDCVYGTWALNYNKGLSTDCASVGFPECVLGKIPSAYSLQ